MRGPVRFFARDRTTGARVDTVGHRAHGDAAFHRTDADAQVAAHTLGVDHLEVPRAVYRGRDGLVRGVFAGDVAAPALDAQVLVDPGLVHVIEIQVLPIGDAGHRLAHQFAHRGKALVVEIVAEPVDQVVDDLESVHHRSGAHLHRGGAQRQEVDRIPPVGDPADTGYRQVGSLARTRNLRDHVQGNGFDGGA